MGCRAMTLPTKSWEPIRSEKNLGAMGQAMLLKDIVQGFLQAPLDKFAPHDCNCRLFESPSKKNQLIKKLAFSRLASKLTTFFGMDQPAHKSPPREQFRPKLRKKLQSPGYPFSLASHQKRLGNSIGTRVQDLGAGKKEKYRVWGLNCLLCAHGR